MNDRLSPILFIAQGLLGLDKTFLLDANPYFVRIWEVGGIALA
jgi:hypothetical protein